MTSAATDREPSRPPATTDNRHRKYFIWSVVALLVVFLTYRAADTCLSCRAQAALTLRLQQQEAEVAAARIDHFFDDIAGQMRWLVQMPWDAGTLEEWQLDSVRLLRQVPAITELARIDGTGRERARVSRIALDVLGSQTDFSRDPAFVQAMANRIYHGPIYFRRDSEPYITLAVAGAREADGIVIAEVNLKFIRDVVSDLNLVEKTTVFAVDNRGRLIAHPDISLVLRNLDLSQLAMVRTALARTRVLKEPPSSDAPGGQHALTTSAPVPSLGGILIICRSKTAADPTTSALCNPA